MDEIAVPEPVDDEESNFAEFGLVFDEAEPPPVVVVGEMRQRIVHTDDLNVDRDTRVAVRLAQPSSAIMPPPVDPLIERKVRREYEWNWSRRYKDWRDQKILNDPNYFARKWAVLRCCCCVLPLMAAFVYVIGGYVLALAAGRPSLDVDLAVVRGHMIYATNSTYNFSRPTTPFDSCDDLTTWTRFDIYGALRALDHEQLSPCACAPMFGIGRPFLTFIGDDNATIVRAFNVTLTPTGPLVSVDEHMPTLFPGGGPVTAWRSESVNVSFLTETCQRARTVVKRPLVAMCVQICVDLFAGRTIYDGIV